MSFFFFFFYRIKWSSHLALFANYHRFYHVWYFSLHFLCRVQRVRGKNAVLSYFSVHPKPVYVSPPILTAACLIIYFSVKRVMCAGYPVSLMMVSFWCWTKLKALKCSLWNKYDLFFFLKMVLWWRYDLCFLCLVWNLSVIVVIHILTFFFLLIMICKTMLWWLIFMVFGEQFHISFI